MLEEDISIPFHQCYLANDKEPLECFGLYHAVMDEYGGHGAGLVTSHMNGLKPFERTIERTTETIIPSSKTITAAAMMTNRITSLRELLHYRIR